MNLKNEKSNVYRFGLPITATIAMFSAIVALMTNPSDVLLLNLQQLFTSALMLLLGTQHVVARKNKYGYFLYLAGGVTITVFLIRIINQFG